MKASSGSGEWPRVKVRGCINARIAGELPPVSRRVSLWHSICDCSFPNEHETRDRQGNQPARCPHWPHRGGGGRRGGTQLQGGVLKRVLDGQLFRLEGGTIPAKDTITLVKGKVTVQKDGSSFTLRPGQIIAMNDGSRVNGDGYYITKDGQRV